MRIDVKKCAAILKEQDNILILTHAHPDGDTLGCGFGLCRALIKTGKKARVINADDIPKKYNYLFEDMPQYDFKENYIVAVDIATENLLGALVDTYASKINLCIDHHGTNTEYAEYLLLEETAAACEIIYKVILELGADIDKKTADCLYTGISTDTGCFRYASSTSSTYRIAADLIDKGADNGYIRKEALQVPSGFSRIVIPISTPSIWRVIGASASVSCSLEPVLAYISCVTAIMAT